jgi:hypothetical protein
MVQTATDPAPVVPPTPVNSEDVDAVKGKWGEDLNTAFQYEKYADGAGAWASDAPRYEWSEDYDPQSIAPRDESLEKQLFGDDNENSMGINFDKFIFDTDVEIDGVDTNRLMSGSSVPRG